MKRLLLLLTLSAVVAVLLTACAAPYRAEDFGGKTALDIVEAYGAFDCITMPAGKDGLYRSCRCGYTVREPRTGFLGTQPEKLFFIVFNEQGIAVSCEEGYRPGG